MEMKVKGRLRGGNGDDIKTNGESIIMNHREGNEVAIGWRGIAEEESEVMAGENKEEARVIVAGHEVQVDAETETEYIGMRPNTTTIGLGHA